VEQAVLLRVESIEHASYLSPASGAAPGVAALAASRADDEQLTRLGRSGIAVCPTLGGFSVAALSKAPPAMLARMREHGVTPQSLAEARRDLVTRMAAAGVRLVSGTDAGIMPGKAHGAYAEAVLELAGALSTVATLAAATRDAADVCGRRTGRLAPGWDADLLVVDGDLTGDLTALRRPVAVVLGGQPLT
jgi:imidazolonepropionase-like amidohydrolase